MNTLHRKINSKQYFQNGAAIIDPVFLQKRASDPDQFTAAADGIGVDRNSWKFDRMCMKGLTFLMWNVVMIYPLVLKIYRENLKISAITGRLLVYQNEK